MSPFASLRSRGNGHAAPHEHADNEPAQAKHVNSLLVDWAAVVSCNMLNSRVRVAPWRDTGLDSLKSLYHGLMERSSKVSICKQITKMRKPRGSGDGAST